MRACQHGDGSGTCVTYTGPTANLGALDNQISWFEVSVLDTGGACDGLSRTAADAVLSGAMRLTSGYIETPEGTGYSGSPGNDKADFCFTVTDPGLYRASGQVRGIDGGGDSFHVTHGGTSSLWDVPIGTGFTADDVSDRNGDDPVLFDLSAGEQTISVHNREDGTRLSTLELIRVGDSGGGGGGGGGGGSCEGLTREAEEGALSGTMQSAGSYVHVPDGTGNASSAGNNKVDLCFTVTDPGLYRVSAQVQGIDGSGDSFFVTYSGASYLWDVPQGSGFTADDVSDRGGDNPVLFDLGAGEQTISVHLREDGTRLDRMTLVRVGDGGGGGGACSGLTAQAEDGVLSGRMQAAGSYVEVPEGSGNASSAGGNSVELCFDVTTAGSYRLDGLVQGMSGTSDSFFVTVNGGSSYLWDLGTTTTFVTDSVSDRGGDNPVIVNLSTGETRVTIHLREDGTRLDAMTLVRTG